MPSATTTTPSKRFAYNVIPMGTFWEITLPGDSVPAGLYLSKEDAIRNAHELARKENKAGVIVYDSEGHVESEYFLD